MIKFKGFTLAEVLISLSIIGVVAALTIPGLVRHYQDAANKAAFKRIYSELSQAVLQYKEDNGGNWQFLTEKSTWKMLDDMSAYIPVAYKCGGASNPAMFKNCWHSGTNDLKDLQGNVFSSKDTGLHQAFRLKNGMFLGISANNSISCPANSSNYCAYFYIDVNGFKGPNQVGRDLFQVWLKDEGLRPIRNSTNPSTSCGAGAVGWGCSKWVLEGRDY
jgi:prepilin-type N-terminal cleavage/methylation domain-containing protein